MALLVAFTITAQDILHPVTLDDRIPGNATVTVYGGEVYYDNGGPSGYYSNNRRTYLTFYPECESQQVELQFTSFDTESGSDKMTIYDGTSTADPILINGYSGIKPPFTVTATNAQGALLVYFASDFSVNRPGWAANVVVNGECVCDLEAAGADFNTIYGYTDEYACVTLAPTLTGGAAPFTYLWDDSDGSTDATLYVCPEANGLHTYTVTVTDANGCTADATFNVDVENIICEAGESGEHKVYLCHKEDGNNPVNVCVDVSSVESHLAHGDGLGMCDFDKSIPVITNECEVLYFDIMGRQLPVRPTEGLYIEVKDGKATKKYIVQ